MFRACQYHPRCQKECEFLKKVTKTLQVSLATTHLIFRTEPIGRLYCLTTVPVMSAADMQTRIYFMKSFTLLSMLGITHERREPLSGLKTFIVTVKA